MSEQTSGGVARLLRLIRKELAESLRDRRTILTLILMPVLLYPLLVIAFQQVATSRNPEKEPKTVYRVGFASEEELRALVDFWLWAPDRRSLPWGDDEAMVKVLGMNPPDVSRLDEGLALFFDERLGIAAFVFPRQSRPLREGEVGVERPDLESAVRAGLLDASVQLEPPGRFRTRPDRPLHVNGVVLAREGSDFSRDASRHLGDLTNRANVRVVTEGLRLIRVPQRADPVQLPVRTVRGDTKPGSDLIPVLVPLILILMTMTGAVYPAIDLTAGERERGTLEILVAAPIPRLAVLFAKYVAVLTVALLTALVNLGMMALTLAVTGIGKQMFPESFNLFVLLQVLALLILFAAFFSAVLLTLTSFARSFKEAQAYLIPLMLFCLLPGMLALMPGMSLNGPLAVVPLMNIVLLARDLFSGQASMGVAAVVILSTLVYAVGAIGLAARIFGAEAVLSSEQSGWGDLFRRPQRAADHLALSSALLCLALMFPVYFLFVSYVGGQGLPLLEGLAWTAAGTALLFAALPLLFLWRARVRLAEGLRLRAARWVGWPAAVLLGVSLWVWASELILLLQQLKLAGLSEDFLERSAQALERWREVSPVPLVLVLGVLVPVLEELFFRGVLFAALLGERGDKAKTAVIGSAALFAVFHVLTPGGLAPERLLTSFLLGLVLGWLASVSGSVLPGIVLHVLHNSVGVLAGYYKPQLIEAGWLTAEQKHVPAWMLAATAVMALVGLALLAWAGRRRVAEGAAATSS